MSSWLPTDAVQWVHVQVLGNAAQIVHDYCVTLHIE